MQQKKNGAYLVSSRKPLPELNTILEESYTNRTQAASNSNSTYLGQDRDQYIKAKGLGSSIQTNGTLCFQHNNSQYLGESRENNQSSVFTSFALSPRRYQTESDENKLMHVVTFNNKKFASPLKPSHKKIVKDFISGEDKKVTIFTRSSSPHSPVKFANSPYPDLKKVIPIDSSRCRPSSPAAEEKKIKHYEEKISSLEKKIREMEEYKKYSIMALIKQVDELKQVVQQKTNQNQHLTSCLQDCKETILELHEEIQCLKITHQEWERSDNEMTATRRLMELQVSAEMENNPQNTSLVHQVRRLSQIIGKLQSCEKMNKTGMDEESGKPLLACSQVSMVIGTNWRSMLNNSMGEELLEADSQEERLEDTEQYNIEQIICSIQTLTITNRQLMEKNAELEEQIRYLQDKNNLIANISDNAVPPSNNSNHSQKTNISNQLQMESESLQVSEMSHSVAMDSGDLEWAEKRKEVQSSIKHIREILDIVAEREYEEDSKNMENSECRNVDNSECRNVDNSECNQSVSECNRSMVADDPTRQ